MSCGLLFLHTRPPLLCSPTHRLLRIKSDLQASLSVLVSSPLSRDCQPCDEHLHRQGYQADLLIQPCRRWVQTWFSSTVLTAGTAGLAWRWAIYWAAVSDLQGLFFPNCCKWLLFSFFWAGFSCHTYSASSNTHIQSIISLHRWLQRAHSLGSFLPPGISSFGFVQVLRSVVSSGKYLEHKSSPLWLPCALKTPKKNYNNEKHDATSV